MPLRDVLLTIDHRPWELPTRPWGITQWWRHLLFAHWPIEPEKLIPLLPEPVTLDLFEGMAWVAVVPFRMAGVRPRFAPALPWISDFIELNLRTYVLPKQGRQQPGVHFWSLEASQPFEGRYRPTKPATPSPLLHFSEALEVAIWPLQRLV
ncbi:DUF2071 domain-containing protein [Bryobacter aggregatus]|uniref:DUF2071 domain-containing protein n=1 Tax=Bryobacter aggregatus TaxID=360054 RepID=UPI00069130A6|nr:DUF2071 domain-containing protein [Bryobacter aggregatus]